MRNLSKTLALVDYERVKQVGEATKQRRPTNSSLSEERKYLIWQRYDQSIRGILEQYGKVGSRDGVMFYHGGGWTNEWYDGFALQHSTALVILTDPVLGDLEGAVSAHHAEALLGFSGDLDTSFPGLEVLITSRGSFAAWNRSTARQCQAYLEKLGFRIP